MSQPSDLLEFPPRHGFRGASARARRTDAPLGLTIAVSREAGARGGTIGRLAGKVFLPLFASFDLLKSPEGVSLIRSYALLQARAR